MRRPFRPILSRPVCAAVALLTVAAGALVGCSKDDARRTLEAFLSGWPSGKLDTVAFVRPTKDKIPSAEVAEQIRKLSGELVKPPPALKIAGDPQKVDPIQTFPVSIDWTLPGGAHWAYQTKIQVSEKDGEWRVIWEPSIVHPDLTDGDELVVRRQAAARASILDGAGQPLVEKRPVVHVQIQPSGVTDLPKLLDDLDKAFKSIPVSVGLEDVPAQVAAAKAKDQAVEVAVLRQPDYLRIKNKIHPLPGTKFVDDQRDLAPSRPFARALLGTVGEVQKEQMDAKPGVYEIGDLVGHGGLEALYEDRLRGAPGQRIMISSKAADDTVNLKEIHRIGPKAGTPLKTTLDQKVQNAADAALRGEKQLRTALVALRIKDGAVLAVANGPDGGTDNLAFTAQVPPGSTFKVVSALGLLDTGAVTLDGPVKCPKNFSAGGRPFKNSDNFEIPGNPPFRVDFARSCNTAFASLAPKLGPDGLAAAGATVGLGGKWDLGIEAFSGKVSTGGSDAERAAAAFGQGTTVVSPLAMAGATAAVARGQWQQPKVLLDPAPAHPAEAGPQLKPESVQALRTMMREVVTKGTATALADAPGGQVSGKTGTAEYDNIPAHTHSWFVGWQGDIAFAVFVEKGGASTATAVPIAERFLRELAKS